MTLKATDARLSKVMEYRRLAETWARDAYLDAKTARLEVEVQLFGLLEKRAGLLAQLTLAERLLLETHEDELGAELEGLREAEASALWTWIQRKREAVDAAAEYASAFDRWQNEVVEERRAA